MRALLTAVLIAALAALVAAPAHADLRLDGHGWGHGVGMSQYGAYGYALIEHRDHAFILGHYYTGTSLARTGKGSIRVLLRSTRTPRLCGATRLRDARGRRIRLSNARVYKFSQLARGRVRVTDTRNGRTRGRVLAPLTISGGASWCLRGPAENGVTGGAYRGAAVVSLDGRSMLVVNRVGLESYLRGVVPSEMPSSWPAEALEAQAVVARSYALRGLRPGSPYDVFADTRSQVYGGVDREVPSSTAAVTATRAEVVTAGGQVAQTFFFSTSGGRTANNEDIFGGTPIGYLRSVDDPHDDLSPYHDWTARFTDKVARRKLRGLGVGSVKTLEVIATTPSGRAATVEATGQDGVIDVSASRIQVLLGLRSTWFDVTESPDS